MIDWWNTVDDWNGSSSFDFSKTAENIYGNFRGGDDFVRDTNNVFSVNYFSVYDLGRGNDTLISIGRNDLIANGGQGDDHFYISTEKGYAQIAGGSGNDTVEIDIYSFYDVIRTGAKSYIIEGDDFEFRLRNIENLVLDENPNGHKPT